MVDWNHHFTQVIRRSERGLWGNWSLDPDIELGAVGILSSAGNFRRIGEISAPTKERRISSKWSVASESVRRTTTAIKLDGATPTADNSAKAGMEIKWDFHRAKSLTSEFAVSRETSFSSAAEAMQGNLATLQTLAKSCGMFKDGLITPGFGVITATRLAKSGLNVGALSDDSSFSISGEAAAVKAFVGSIAGSGSFSSSQETKALAKHFWPGEQAPASGEEVAIAYRFASFAGNTIIAEWESPLPALSFRLVNDVGSTYVVDAKLTYKSKGAIHTVTGRPSGGIDWTVNLPLDSTEVHLHLNFLGSPNVLDFEYPSPLAEWPGGKYILHVWGVWPGSPNFRDELS